MLIIYAEHSAFAFASVTLLRKIYPDAKILATRNAHALSVVQVEGHDVLTLGLHNKKDLEMIARFALSLESYFDHSEHRTFIPEAAHDTSMVAAIWERTHGSATMPEMLQHMHSHRPSATVSVNHYSRALMEALYLHPFEYETYEQLMEDCSEAIIQGEGILLYKRVQVRRLVKQCQYLNNIWGVPILPVVNVPKFLVGAVLGELESRYAIALSYHDTRGKRYWSIRAGRSSLNVGEFCTSLGGGGNNRAGGFTTEIDINIDMRSLLVNLYTEATG
jgi:hypothetical protein